MPASINKTLNNHQPTDTEKNVLKLLLGEKTCTQNQATRFWWFVGFALIITILFYFCVCYYSANPCWILILFFILVLGIDAIFTRWRETNPLCVGCNRVN